jgi:hypothetical protein
MSHLAAEYSQKPSSCQGFFRVQCFT